MNCAGPEKELNHKDTHTTVARHPTLTVIYGLKKKKSVFSGSMIHYYLV